MVNLSLKIFKKDWVIRKTEISSSKRPPLPVFLQIELDHGHDFDQALLGLAGFFVFLFGQVEENETE